MASLRARARDGDARADAAALEQAQIVATLLQLRLARWQYARFSPGGFGGLDLGYSSAKSKIEGALAQLRPGLFRPSRPPPPQISGSSPNIINYPGLPPISLNPMQLFAYG